MVIDSVAAAECPAYINNFPQPHQFLHFEPGALSPKSREAGFR